MNSRQQFEHRANTRIITLKEIEPEYSEPERLRLQLSVRTLKKPLDLGSLAYFICGKNECDRDDRGTPVVIGSLIESRRELIVKLLESFRGLRERSVMTYFKQTEYFVAWLNTNGYREVFASVSDSQRAYRDYTGYLNHQVHHQKRNVTSASSFQMAAARLIELIYPEDSHYVLAGAVRIIPEKGSAAARATHVELYRDVCLAIAQQCSDFVLGHKSYPFVVNIRDYEVVMFPSLRGAVGPFKEAPLAYNPAERRIATVEEYIAASVGRERKGLSKSSVTRDLAKAQVVLDVANQNARHWHRIHVASLAARAYACLFLIITGATPTEFAQFSWKDALEVENSPIKKELSSVKFRAGKKSTFYNIGRDAGLSILREYIKLRKWILNGVEHEKLFFAVPAIIKQRDRINSFPDLEVTGVVSKFYDVISGTFLDPKVPRISPRKMRKYKSNVMHSARISPPMVAASLNHTEAVNRSTYAEATPEQQEAELGQFWQAIRHAANVVRERSEKASIVGVPIATGHCDAFNQPTPISDSGPIAIEPNCHTQYGCLYCEHYVCHSDEEDVHKLMSLQYVINAVRKGAPDYAHAEVLYKELSIRIEFILSTLCERSESVRQMVDRVRAKVFEYGDLTVFWEARLSRYEKVGVVF